MKYDLLQLLLNAEYITKTDVSLLREFKAKWQMSAFSAILRTHLLSEPVLADILAKLLYLDKVEEIKPQDIGVDAFSMLTYRQALEWEAMPLGREGNGPYRFVVVDPTREEVLRKLEECVGDEVMFLVGERKMVLRAIDFNYPVEDQMPNLSAKEHSHDTKICE